MNFTSLVGERFSSLTPAQQLIARYIERNKERVAFMTAKQLAGAINVSDAAIIRFSRALGYRGYTHLREDLGEALIEKTGLSGVFQWAPMSSSDTELKEQVFANGSLLIEQTAALNQPETIVRIADKLVSARRIWVTAHGTTHAMAVYLAMQLNVLKNAEVFNIGVGDIADRIRHVSEEDVFIGIGYERYIPYTIEMMHLARLRGAYIVAVTDRPSSPLANESNEALYVAHSTSQVAWWSQIGTLIIADWLMSQMVVRNTENVRGKLQESDKVWELLGHWKNDNTRETLINKRLNKK
ncbi:MULTISPECIES: MurR/RpiR family transcriptional regulator [unclassified Brenneria]|uniref:MurR/RpiR family transcriptional regulator n=1 Tax=unclassified Brenneria TaxID=2634434 RepID=UPI0015549159|nr:MULTISPECIES: MurR/RpiR family transcriptional regulator [unclassified Brenneria]MBJ7221538.1 MurR/RpiR family transcriptional regulator [Brenneria sp. L3-3C-1]MEE3642780.1 MurR/RpiR family transcriptional regulator [Brenneria sp. L3_3C_1]MEE3651038.1 MurR/RpiR family transcriptional regulator [Brenneria sp. HEZEL_4_2_4]NPD00993.1 MurR/RpiR family transcriptional regulator [Brenneria sp. hezel4-2-4]